MFVVVCYDIPDDKRRTKVMNVLKDFGTRVQYSVFECDLTPDQTLTLRDRIRTVIAPRKDDVRFYFLCESCVARRKRLGGKPEPVRPDVIFV